VLQTKAVEQLAVMGATELATIQRMIDALPFYALLIDEDHRILAANTATRDALGVEPEEILCQHCPGVIHGTEGPYPGCPLERAVATSAHVETEMQDERTGRWFRSSVSPAGLSTGDGHQVYLHFTQDITDRRRAVEDLARSLEHHQVLSDLLRQLQMCQTAPRVLEVLIDSVQSLSWIGLAGPAAGFLVDGEELRLAARRNLDEEVSRGCAQVALGHCLCGRVAVEGRVEVLDHVDGVGHHQAAEHGHVAVPLIHRGQVLAVANFYTRPGQEIGRDQIGFLETVAAIAAVALDRLQMQTELVHSDRLASMGLIASVVAHEIRTPLNALSINVQMISRRLRREGDIDRREIGELLDTLQAEVQRINHQIEDHLLTVVRHQPNRLRPVHVNDLVQESIRFMRAEADYKRVELTCSLADAVPLILADSNKVRRILLNIVLNAIQALPDGGAVSVATRRSEDQVVVSVQDNGPGISDLGGSDLDQVFLPFVTTKRDGTGLGLAICARLAKEMGGRIRVESAPGKGARFDIYFRQP